MSNEFIITLPVNETIKITDSLQHKEINHDCISSKNFDGMSEVMQILVTLTTVSVPVIGKILIESIRAKSKISIKYKNIELTGLDEKEAVILIEKLDAKQKNLLFREREQQ